MEIIAHQKKKDSKVISGMIRHSSLIIVIIFCLSSCVHTYYMPSVQNVTLFKERNELRVAAHRGMGYSDLDGFPNSDILAAYSVTDKFSIMGNYMSTKNTYGYDGDSVRVTNSWGKGQYIDCAAGYYKSISKSLVFETYCGLGASSQHHSYANNRNTFYGTSDLYFTKLFVQPSVGFTTKPFDIALSVNISRLSFYKITNHLDSLMGGYDVSPDYSRLAWVDKHRNSVLVEPAITIRGGWKYVKVQLQYLRSFNYPHYNMPYGDTNISIGLYIAIAKRYGKIF